VGQGARLRTSIPPPRGIHLAHERAPAPRADRDDPSEISGQFGAARFG
jgi:hypothetical protein